MANEKQWSNNTVFPLNNSLTGSETLVGLKSGSNFKTNVDAGIVNRVNGHAQLASTSQVTGLDTALSGKMDKSQNLLDVSDRKEAQLNIGFADKVFTATGATNYALSTMPCVIIGNFSAPGHTITLSAVNKADGATYSQMPYIYCIGQSFDVLNNSGSVLLTLLTGEAYQLTLSNNSTAGGTWIAPRGDVISVNNAVGNVSVSLQNSYSVGSGGIQEQDGKPFYVKDGTESSPVDNELLAEFSSSTQGTRPWPTQTTAEINAIAPGKLRDGMSVYDQNIHILKLYNGSNFKDVLFTDNVISTDNTISIDTSTPGVCDLSADPGLSSLSAGDGIDYDNVNFIISAKLEAGDNITLTTQPSGAIRIDSDSETPTDQTSDFGSFNVLDNTTSTTAAAGNTYYPIFTDPSKFSQKSVSNWVGEMHTISTINTPCLRYINAGEQYALFNFNLSVIGSNPTDQSYTYELCLQKSSDNSIVPLGYYGYSRSQDIQFPHEVSITGVALLQTDDRVFVRFKNDLNAQGITVRTVTASAVSLNTASLFNEGSWSPFFTIYAGISSITPVAAWYDRQQSNVNFNMSVDIVVTSSSSYFGVSLPFPANFTTTAQAIGGSLSFIDVNAPTVLDGIVEDLFSDFSNQRLSIKLLSSVGSGTKRVILSGSYKIN